MATPASASHARTTSGFNGSPAAQAWRRSGSARSSARLAIARYSVGDMQSTFTPSRTRRSSRSSASKRASCSNAAAPRTQAATNALRAESDQPLAAVHQHRSPGCAPYQCSA